jgi:phosphoserine aminotransferase
MGDGIDAQDVPTSDMIATTLNETSTGVQLASLPKLYDPQGDRLLAVDATSGAGQIACDISATDIFFFSPQKILASDGGLWITFLSPKAVAKAQRLSANKGRYVPEIMRFDHALENSRKAQTYNTPAIATLFFLNEQIKELNKLGQDKVCAMAEEKAKFIYGWALEKPYLSPFIKEEKYRSRSVATIDIDDSRVKADDVVEYISMKKWVYGIDGYRKLGRNQLRISLFHNIKLEDLQKLTQLLSTLIESKL